MVYILKGKVSQSRLDRVLGCCPAGLLQSSGPLGRCSSCDGLSSPRVDSDLNWI
jgi:hypothetical protein